MGKFDTSYKQFFSHAQMVRELLQGFVKESWVKQIDFSTLEKCNNSYVADDLRERMDDVIWKVRWQDKDLYLYILLELQSSIDKFMSIRIMTYIGLLYQDLIKSKSVKKNQLLPPILPIVLYNGGKKWNASLSVQDIIYPAPRGLNKYTPKLEYMLIDEVRTSDENLKNINNCVTALFQLEKCRDAQAMTDIISNLIEWLKSPETDSLRRAFTVWICRVLMPARFGDEKLPEIENLEEVNTMLVETVKQWPKQWMEKGKIEFAMNLLDILDVETIANKSGLSIQQIKELKEAKKNKVQEKSSRYTSAKKKSKSPRK